MKCLLTYQLIDLLDLHYKKNSSLFQAKMKKSLAYASSTLCVRESDGTYCLRSHAYNKRHFALLNPKLVFSYPKTMFRHAKFLNSKNIQLTGRKRAWSHIYSQTGPVNLNLLILKYIYKYMISSKKRILIEKRRAVPFYLRFCGGYRELLWT